MAGTMQPFLNSFLCILLITIYIYIILGFVRKNRIRDLRWINFSIGSLLVLKMFPFIIIVPSAPATGNLLSRIDQLFLTSVETGGIKVSIGMVVFCVGMIGALYKITEFCRKSYKLRRSVRRFITEEGDTVQKIRACLKEQGMEEIQIAIVPCQISPMITGVARPILVFPDYDFGDQLPYIIRHEAEHYRNDDLILRFLMELTACIYWWNPVVYIMKRGFLLTMEIYSDQEAVRNLPAKEKLNYAECIIQIAASVKRKSWMTKANTAIAFSGPGKKNIGVRVSSILEGKGAYKKGKEVIAYILIVMITLVFSASFNYGENVQETMMAKNTYFLKEGKIGYSLYRDDEYGGYYLYIPEALQVLEIYNKVP